MGFSPELDEWLVLLYKAAKICRNMNAWLRRRGMWF
jgi:hypothetical protein